MRTEFTPKFFRRIIICCPIIIVMLCIIQLLYLRHFNAQEYVIHGEETSGETYFSMANRGDSTSVWLKRDFPMNRKLVDLTGETVDGVLHNDSNDEISSWFMRINIVGDCFINNSWCGVVEIHQNVNTPDEAVQTLDLRNYSIEDVELEYRYDGDLLIPLKKGDYIVYYPSEKDMEIPISKKSELTMGMIFYHLNDLDLSNFVLTYSYHRKFVQGKLFYPILLLVIFWIIHVIIYYFTLKIYEDARRELELKKSGISSMSDMYNTIYIVDLVKNEIVSVVAEEQSDFKRPENLGADEQFRNLFEFDSTEAFKDLVLDFCDLSTLRERMGDSNNIACEYVSKTRGWCRIRFFAMDYVEGHPVDNVVFTLQVIDNEKKEIEEITNKVAKIETEMKQLNVFFRFSSNEIIAPLQEALALDDKVIAECKDDSIVEDVRSSHLNVLTVHDLLHDVVDFAMMEAGELEIKNDEYSLADIIEEIDKEIKPYVDSGKINFKKNIKQGIPDRLYGDKPRILQCLKTLLHCRLDMLDSGDMTFSVFGKELNGTLHLLFSIRDSGPLDKRDSKKFRYVLINGILKLMDSALYTLEEEDGSENYFEIEQEVRE